MSQNANWAVSLLGLLFMLIFVGGIITLMIFVWGTIFKKAGYSFWMALLMFVPIANLVWLLIFALSKWPIQQELDAYRAQYTGTVPGAFPTIPPASRA